MQYDTARPYIASYVILRRDGKIAFVLRENTTWMNGYYSLPSGKVEDGESFVGAAIRETKEEAGVTVRAEHLLPLLTCHRNSPDNDMTWVDVVFEATEWEGEVVNGEPELHSELAWLDPDKLPENVIPMVVFLLEQIKAGNTYCEYSWGVEKIG